MKEGGKEGANEEGREWREEGVKEGGSKRGRE